MHTHIGFLVFGLPFVASLALWNTFMRLLAAHFVASNSPILNQVGTALAFQF